MSDVNAVLTRMTDLDGAITRRLQIEDAFIQAMVTEFNLIKAALQRCNDNQDARNPGSPDLGPIIVSLNRAIQKLQTAAPLNEANLDNMIQTVVGDRRTVRTPFLQGNPGAPPDATYPYMNHAAPVQRPAAVNPPANLWTRTAAFFTPSSPASAAAPTASSAASAASSNASLDTGRSRVGSDMSDLSDGSSDLSDGSGRPTSSDASVPGLGLSFDSTVGNRSRAFSVGGWRTRRRRSKRNSKKRKP